MKRMKKVLAFVLSLVLCIGCLPAVSFAEGEEDDSSTYALTRVSFDTNGGSGSVDRMYVNSGDEITFPEYDGTKSGYAFCGWSTDNDANGSGTDHHRSAVYQPGETCTIYGRTTFYAVWAKTNETSSFYLRLDGRIPQEPCEAGKEDNYNSDSYTYGVTIKNALKEAKFYANTTGVDDNLNSAPTNAQLVEMINADPVEGSTPLGFKVAAQDGNVVVTEITNAAQNAAKYNVAVGDVVYVVWYVVKQAAAGPVLSGYAQSTWHVDGVLLTKAKVTLTYSSGNAPAGTVSNMPIGTQWNAGSTVVVGTNDTENNVIKEPARNDGYTFIGWEMYFKDDNGDYTVDKGLYNTDERFTISEDTLLVAQWKKGSNVLKFKKTDTEGKALSDAEFAISSDSLEEPITFTTGANGTFTGGFENQTIYTVTETKAPVGYKTIDPFNFMVTLNDDEELGAYVVDAGGNIIDTPEGVAISYANGTVSLTVADEGEFYVYYSHDQSVKTFPLTETFDITKEVTEGYLYGGYYSAYKKAGSYTGGPVNELKDGKNYNGATAGYWDASAAYNELGTEMHPVAGRTYYLKEVPEAYFQPYMQIVYDGSAAGAGHVEELYLISATDDKNYQKFGIQAEDPYTQVKAFTASFKLQSEVNVNQVTTITAKSAFGVPTGFLGVWDAKDELVLDNEFVYRPYVVTLDGVTVYGVKTRTVYTGNVTYTGTFDSGDGIRRVDSVQ